MMKKALLHVQQLRLRFENQLDKDILSNIDFELKKGETVLLLGPSGCGKSTLTFCLNGLYPRELDGTITGDVFINGKQSTDYKPGELSRHVGVVFQDPETQFCMLTVEDEIAFGLENLNVPQQLMEEKIDNALSLVNMSAFKESAINSLSGGQKQKLALACILAMEPDLLILDEPTANLDPVATKELVATIENLKRQQEFSLIVIEHQLDGWMELVDRTLLLNKNGELFFDGSFRNGIKHILPCLREQGIWLPKVTQYVLQQDGLNEDFIPLTIGEFANQSHYWQQPICNTAPQKKRNVEEFLEINDISWVKNNNTIIQNVSANFYKGEFVAIVGANGSGKTSLSRLLAGIQKPTSGTIQLNGKPLDDWKEETLRDEIGYVFQNPEHQFVTNSVYEEVAFSLHLKRMNTREINKQVSSILKVCQLSELENEHPYSLSQGQKRRLSVATMIVDQQHMLILDEPTFGQDTQSTMELMKLLWERHKQGTTIVMITHDMEIVHHYAERVIVINNGEIVADCNPNELWKQPKVTLNAWQLDYPIQVQLQQICKKDTCYVSTQP
ncbi:ABC transporter ATP-binding protein [Virgibacillus ndiopensis]|uniref:ABC transporter ATP-binding protein n=1 Tax=Virgibacillus ndiopensis TaxID=2004408 RepID=UPI000C06BDF5|nr:ABC transporter ATP-binding protein [Virgibacillus ndiopensis]